MAGTCGSWAVWAAGDGVNADHATSVATMASETFKVFLRDDRAGFWSGFRSVRLQPDVPQG